MKKIAISWLELVLFTVIILSGMSFWSLAERQVLVSLEQQEPKEDNFLHRVIVSESELSAIEKQLSVFQEQLLQTTIDYRKLTFSLEYIKSVYPDLHNTVSIPNDVLLVPTVTMQRYLSKYATLQDDELESLQQNYPSLTSIAEIISDTQPIPLEIAVSYIDTQIQLMNTEFLSHELDMQLTVLTSEKINLSQDIIDARDLSNREFRQAQYDYSQMCRLRTLGWASLYAAGFLLVTRLLIAILLCFSKNIRKSFNVSLIFCGAFVLLLLLFIYQAFNLLGIALSSILVLFLMLPFISHRHVPLKLENGETYNE